MKSMQSLAAISASQVDIEQFVQELHCNLATCSIALQPVDVAGGDLATEGLEAALANSNASVQQLQERVDVLLAQLNVMEAAQSTDMKALSEQLATANASLAAKEATIRWDALRLFFLPFMHIIVGSPEVMHVGTMQFDPSTRLAQCE